MRSPALLLARVLFLLSLALPAFAGALEVRAVGAPVVVVRGTRVLGPAPFTLSGVEGDLDLGFRAKADGPTLFSKTVPVPADGLVVLEVDLAARTAVIGGSAATVPVVVSSGPSGDVYVNSTPSGLAVWLDGRSTGLETPTMLRGVATGKRRVEVRTTCERGLADVVVAKNVITRVELAPDEGKGVLSVQGSPSSARVTVDGAEVGKVPVTVKDLTCGAHTVRVRAPGYLEATRSVSVTAFEQAGVQVDLQKEEFGTLVVDVTPLDALVRVDGVDLGVGPRTIEGIAAGPHTVAAVRTGYSPTSLDIVVTADDVTRATIVMTASGTKGSKKGR